MGNTPLWLPQVLQAIGMMVFGIGLILLARNKHRKRLERMESSKDTSRLPVRKLADLPVGQTIIIIDFTEDNRPIAEFTDEYQLQLPRPQRNFFIIESEKKFAWGDGRTYEIEKAADSGEIRLKHVVMMLERTFAKPLSV